MSDTLEQNKKLVERLYAECINAGNLDSLQQLVSDDFVGSRGEKGPFEFGRTITMVRTGFPDAHFTLEDTIAENDRVVARWKMEGTHGGPFAGIPASHNPVKHSAIVIYQIRDAKIVRAWLQPDTLGLMQQIGAIPLLAAAAPKA
jgi:steroid delta-isomerase-like uncharacterized protein